MVLSIKNLEIFVGQSSDIMVLVPPRLLSFILCQQLNICNFFLYNPVYQRLRYLLPWGLSSHQRVQIWWNISHQDMSTEVDTVNAYGHFVLIHSHIKILIHVLCWSLKDFLIFQIRNRNRTTLELQHFLKQMNQSISGQKVLELHKRVMRVRLI